LTPPTPSGKFRGIPHRTKRPTLARRRAAELFGNGIGEAIVPIAPTVSRKTTAVLSLVVHLLVAGVVPSLDGTLEALADDRQVHVEAPGDGPCAPLHDHATCQLCRIVDRGVLAAAPAVAVLNAAPAMPLPVLVEHPAPPIAAIPSPLRPRAPPIA